MNKHTPGPWKYNLHACGPSAADIQGKDSSCPNDPLRIRTVAVICSYAGPEEAKANALLIAAAPDLLKVCNGLIDVIKYTHAISLTNEAPRGAIWGKTRQIMAAARIKAEVVIRMVESEGENETVDE